MVFNIGSLLDKDVYHFELISGAALRGGGVNCLSSVARQFLRPSSVL